jgi:ATP-binding cassette, subfamily A (ABC1), member 3
MTNLQLNEYKDVRSKKLSGGNKRKLCVAMSLVGNPSLVFLDEPSAGVDPIARRYLWNVLHSSSSLKNRSIVLTTHSINEAESLCSRIGILIKG